MQLIWMFYPSSNEYSMLPRTSSFVVMYMNISQPSEQEPPKTDSSVRNGKRVTREQPHCDEGVTTRTVLTQKVTAASAEQGKLALTEYQSEIWNRRSLDAGLNFRNYRHKRAARLSGVLSPPQSFPSTLRRHGIPSMGVNFA